MKKLLLLILMLSVVSVSGDIKYHYKCRKHKFYFESAYPLSRYITFMKDFYQWQNNYQLVNLTIMYYHPDEYKKSARTSVFDMAVKYDYKVLEEGGVLPNEKNSYYLLCNSDDFGPTVLAVIMDDERGRAYEIDVITHDYTLKESIELVQSAYVGRK